MSVCASLYCSVLAKKLLALENHPWPLIAYQLHYASCSTLIALVCPQKEPVNSSVRVLFIQRVLLW